MTTYYAQVVVSSTVVDVWHFEYPITLSGGSIVVASSPPETINPKSGQTFFIQAGAALGWTVAGGVLIAPAGSGTPPTMGQLNTFAQNKAQNVLNVGFTVTISSVAYEFATDTLSLVAVNSAMLRLSLASPPSTVSWPFLTGAATLSAANFTTAAIHLYDWILAVEAELDTVLAGIAGSTITAYSQVEAASWPAAHYP